MNIEKLVFGEKRHINVNKYNKGLASLLCISHGYLFDTVCGKVSSVRQAMDILLIPNYPKSLVGKLYINPEDVKLIPNIRPTIPNYWGLVARITLDRITKDDMVKRMLLELPKEVPIVSYAFCPETRKPMINNRVIVYCKILKDIHIGLHNGNLDGIVEKYTKDKTCSIYTGTIEGDYDE